RTGSLFALEQENVAADITTLAKGLAAGYQPIAAVMASERVVASIESGSGSLWNGHTYMSHAIATAGALAVQKVIEEDHMLDNVRARGEQLRDGLNAQFGKHPNVGDIRGRGLFWSLELVRDKDTKNCFPAEAKLSQKIGTAALDIGLMCYPAQGCVDGTNGDHILLAPSYTSTPEEIEQIIDLTGAGITAALAEMEY
ncbi:MAG: aminotransferase class III-fold pyridoxal phosphate-dependent enzyme, partial [Planctomycetota bacterium]